MLHGSAHHRMHSDDHAYCAYMPALKAVSERRMEENLVRFPDVQNRTSFPTRVEYVEEITKKRCKT